MEFGLDTDGDASVPTDYAAQCTQAKCTRKQYICRNGKSLLYLVSSALPPVACITAQLPVGSICTRQSVSQQEVVEPCKGLNSRVPLWLMPTHMLLTMPCVFCSAAALWFFLCFLQ